MSFAWPGMPEDLLFGFSPGLRENLNNKPYVELLTRLHISLFPSKVHGLFFRQLLPHGQANQVGQANHGGDAIQARHGNFYSGHQPNKYQAHLRDATGQAWGAQVMNQTAPKPQSHIPCVRALQ